MAFQDQVQTYPSKAVPGQRASGNTVVYKTPTPLAHDDVPVGGFVFELPSPTAGAVQSTSTAVSNANCAGFIERIQTNINFDPTVGYSAVIPASYPAATAVKGEFYVKAETAAVIGQEVFADITGTGKIKTAAHGATVSGYMPTGWYVKTAQATVGEIFIISNWS